MMTGNPLSVMKWDISRRNEALIDSDYEVPD